MEPQYNGASVSLPLEVLITIDVEAWPRVENWRQENLEGDLLRDVYGATPVGDFGIKYQAELLAQHGLKGVFFVEALFACEVGVEPLRRIVRDIQESGSEVQLHIHTEWFEKMREPFIDKRAYNIRELNEEQQVAVIQRAKQNLEMAGAEKVVAYRAGNFGADRTTLRALRRAGIDYDASYNECYLSKDCAIDVPGGLVQPAQLEELWELPVSIFEDYPGHLRPAQLCAISAWEMREALKAARKAEWQSFVIVSHSFEMLRDRKNPRPEANPDWSVIHRFDALCQFLARNRKLYRTVGFLDMTEPKARPEAKPLKFPTLASSARTSLRVLSQAMRRLPYDRETQLRAVLSRVGLGKI